MANTSPTPKKRRPQKQFTASILSDDEYSGQITFLNVTDIAQLIRRLEPGDQLNIKRSR